MYDINGHFWFYRYVWQSNHKSFIYVITSFTIL